MPPMTSLNVEQRRARRLSAAPNIDSVLFLALREPPVFKYVPPKEAQAKYKAARKSELKAKQEAAKLTRYCECGEVLLNGNQRKCPPCQAAYRKGYGLAWKRKKREPNNNMSKSCEEIDISSERVEKRQSNKDKAKKCK